MEMGAAAETSGRAEKTKTHGRRDRGLLVFLGGERIPGRLQSGRILPPQIPEDPEGSLRPVQGVEMNARDLVADQVPDLFRRPVDAQLGALTDEAHRWRTAGEFREIFREPQLFSIRCSV